jgi:hypothetical protein
MWLCLRTIDCGLLIEAAIYFFSPLGWHDIVVTDWRLASLLIEAAIYFFSPLGWHDIVVTDWLLARPGAP